MPEEYEHELHGWTQIISELRDIGSRSRIEQERARHLLEGARRTCERAQRVMNQAEDVTTRSRLRRAHAQHLGLRPI